MKQCHEARLKRKEKKNKINRLKCDAGRQASTNILTGCKQTVSLADWYSYQLESLSCTSYVFVSTHFGHMSVVKRLH